MTDRVVLPLDAYLRIAARCGYKCPCGQGYDPLDPFVADHIIALANGGTNHESNYRIAHKSCNEVLGAISATKPDETA